MKVKIEVRYLRINNKGLISKYIKMQVSCGDKKGTEKPEEYKTAQTTVTYAMCDNLNYSYHRAILDTSTGHYSTITGQTRRSHTTIQSSTTNKKPES